MVQMVGTPLENGQLENSSPGNTLETERLQEKTRMTKEELGVIKQDLNNNDLTRKEAEFLANDKAHGVNV